MSKALNIRIESLPASSSGTLVILVDEANAYAQDAAPLLGAEGQAALERAVAAESFKGKANKTLTVLGPSAGLERIVAVGAAAQDKPLNAFELGGVIVGALGKAAEAKVLAVAPDNAPLSPEAVADLALGARLRFYRFDKYKTKKKDEDETPGLTVTFLCADPAAARKALKSRDAIADGVELARSLVNEPPNVLYPAEFAKQAEALKKLGVEVEILGEKELKKLGMRTLLAVGQGSVRESQVVIMRWNGGKKSQQPVAFVGKGVTFDTGGISIKPAAGMEDMKGDMAGAACVVGLMQALAARKAKVNAIGAIGLVENMPGGNAYRPGDILTSLSGQTIEVVNTDAEGRLVLADVLWYVQDTYKPIFMVNLATLTGAILVALGQEHAGLFSNSDELAQRLSEVGLATGEKVWRLPLGPEYDKLIDSKFADMKNTGGRNGGSITAAQFLQRFVNGTPWAHLDIAGTGMGSPQNETSRAWASGWGVRLLDRLVAEHYEAK